MLTINTTASGGALKTISDYSSMASWSVSFVCQMGNGSRSSLCAIKGWRTRFIDRRPATLEPVQDVEGFPAMQFNVRPGYRRFTWQDGVGWAGAEGQKRLPEARLA